MASIQPLSPMKRRSVLAGIGTVVGVLSAGCLGGSSRDRQLTDGFETDLQEWETDADVPDDPNNPGHPVDWSITRSTERAATGDASVKYVLDGRQDDGTIWIVRTISIDPDRQYLTDVSAQAWSQSESFNTIAHLVMYLGPDRPSSEQSFPGPMENSTGTDWPAGGLREPLNRRTGWDEYAFTWETPRLDTDTLYFAIGISAVWETEMTYFVDDVVVNIATR